MTVTVPRSARAGHLLSSPVSPPSSPPEPLPLPLPLPVLSPLSFPVFPLLPLLPVLPSSLLPQPAHTASSAAAWRVRAIFFIALFLLQNEFRTRFAIAGISIR